MADGGDRVLSVRGLCVHYGATAALAGLDLDLRVGNVTALVGASGSGKSTAALAIVRLLPAAGRIVGGSIGLRHRTGSGEVELTAASERTLRTVRGRRIAMIFQSPGSALNPVMTVGAQVGEALLLTGSGAERRRPQAIASLLAEVELDAAVAWQYPHQLSGGMQQRVMIAMALAGGPEILLADEPTSALDVSVQARILALMKRLQRTRRMAVLLITHDLAVAAQLADEVLVLDRGRIVERGSVAEVLGAARSPAAQRLVAAARMMAVRAEAVGP